MSGDLKSRLAALAEEFRRGAPEKLATARTALAELRDGKDSGDARERMFRVFHSLAGAGGTHGQPEVSRLAFRGETILRAAPGALDESSLTELTELLDALDGQFAE